MSMETSILTSDQDSEGVRALYYKCDALVKTHYILLNTFLHIRNIYMYNKSNVILYLPGWLLR